MTRNDVIKTLEYMISGDCCDTQYDFIKEIEFAIKEMKMRGSKLLIYVRDPGAICPICKWPLYPKDHPHYCGNCGTEVKWDDP